MVYLSPYRWNSQFLGQLIGGRVAWKIIDTLSKNSWDVSQV